MCGAGGMLPGERLGVVRGDRVPGEETTGQRA